MADTPAGPYDRYEEEAKGFRLGPPPPPAPPHPPKPDDRKPDDRKPG